MNARLRPNQLKPGEVALSKNGRMNEDLKNTVDALTHGDVSALVEQGMEKHKSGFEEFTSYIKKILIIAACVLAAYLSIPIFVARKTAETCSKKHLTRPPFPTNEKL